MKTRMPLNVHMLSWFGFAVILATSVLEINISNFTFLYYGYLVGVLLIGFGLAGYFLFPIINPRFQKRS